jgi:hypothetical protein
VRVATAYTFPAEVFVVEGDPEAVRESGRSYGRFAATAAEAAAGLRGLDSGAWLGSEGDLFRARVAEISPHLDTAHSAFAQVAVALDGFAEALATSQRQMAAVRVDAEQTFGSLAGARADHGGLVAPSGEEIVADPAAQTTYAEQRDVLEARIGRLHSAWQEQLATAGGVRARLLEAARRAGATIRAAGRTSPTADQNWFQARWEKSRRWASEQADDLKSFVAEHAAALRSVAKALRVVGVALVAVGAVLAVLGFGAAIMAAGLVVWGAGDVLDATVDWAQGRISGQQLIVSTGLALGLSVVGGGAVKLSAKALERLGRRARRFIADAGRQTDPNLPRAGPPAAGAGGRLPLDRTLVKRIAAQAGVGLDGVKFRIHRSAPSQGMFGETTPDGILHLYPNAFRSEEELVKTLGHERIHVWQVKTHGYPARAERKLYEDAAKATEAQWWDYYQMNQRL